MQRISLTLIGMGFIVSLAVGTLLFGANTNIVKDPDRFEGKFVSLYLKGGKMEHGHQLKDVRIEEVEGIKMLIGIGISSDEDDWTVGVETYVPYDTIGTMFAMTAEQYAAGKNKNQSKRK